ncbi:MAG: type II toxin-antitoxin system HicA family toxin [bacterium]
MSKLAPTSPETLAKILEKAGFFLDRIKGSHHIYINQETNKRAVVPFHKKELPRGTFFEILRQAGISRKQFEKLQQEI